MANATITGTVKGLIGETPADAEVTFYALSTTGALIDGNTLRLGRPRVFQLLDGLEVTVTTGLWRVVLSSTAGHRGRPGFEPIAVELDITGNTWREIAEYVTTDLPITPSLLREAVVLRDEARVDRQAAETAAGEADEAATRAEAVGVTTAGQMSSVDADPASEFRQQQDQRLELLVRSIVRQGPAPSGDTTGATDHDAIAAAIAALPGGIGVVQLQSGGYFLDAELWVPNKVALLGLGREATTISAGSAFVETAGSAVVVLGTRAGGGSPIFASRVDRLTIDGKNKADFCLYSNQANEMCGAEQVNANNFKVVGLEFADGCQNVRNVRSIEAYALNATAAVAGVRFTNVPGACAVSDLTSYGKSTSPMTAGVYSTGTNLVATAIHTENAVSGVDAGGSAPVAVIGATGPSGAAVLTNVVRQRGDCRYVTVRNISKNNAAVAVRDDFRGISYTDAYVMDLSLARGGRAVKQFGMNVDFTSTAFADFGNLAVAFTPERSTAVVTIAGVMAPLATGGGTNTTTFRASVTPDGGAETTSPFVGQIEGTSGNPAAIAGMTAMLSGLTPGRQCVVKLQAKVATTAGEPHTYCRPTSVPREYVTLTVDDLGG